MALPFIQGTKPMEFWGLHLQNPSKIRVLQFECAPMYDYVPPIESLGDLSFLRYLSFRSGKIVHLPKLIGELHNLETLDLRQTDVYMMPRDIYKLKKLRHLRGFGLQMDSGIGDLTSLQTLRQVDISHLGWACIAHFNLC